VDVLSESGELADLSPAPRHSGHAPETWASTLPKSKMRQRSVPLPTGWKALPVNMPTSRRKFSVRHPNPHAGQYAISFLLTY
jgi:hypothetical protein